MSNEQQPVDKLVFREGEVFIKSKGGRKPIEEVVGENNPGNIMPIQTLKSVAADFAELNGR